jgi:outer membrane protein OmpA-like peptidoglycan-associated protein
VCVAGCASPPPPSSPPNRSYVTLLASPDGSVGQVVVQGDLGVQRIEQANYAALLNGSTPAARVDEAQLQRDFGEAMAARPELPQHFVLYFASGGAHLTPESQAQLSQIVESAARRTTVDISVIGHSDTVGKAELNEALSLKRAQTVAELIQAKGLKVDALTIASHGKRNLLVPTPDETPEPRNRRVEISIR